MAPTAHLCQSKEKSMQEDWRDGVWQRYGEFFDRSAPYSIGIHSLPIGWRELVDTTLDRISLVVETDKLARLAIHGLSRERGVMKIRWTASTLRFETIVTDIIDRASARSSVTCETCGDAGVRYRVGDDAVAACAVHRTPGAPEIRPAWPSIRIEREIVSARVTIKSCRVYDRDADKFVDAAPADLGIGDLS
jgi:hypothetical protein